MAVFFYGIIAPLPLKLIWVLILKRKTPDQLVNLKNRNIEKSDEEAHLQLTLNLFRKMKWGLMFKSIDLFDQKYPNSKNNSFNEFLN